MHIRSSERFCKKNCNNLKFGKSHTDMKRIILFLLFAVSFNLSEGQTTGFLKELENSTLQIRQKPGTDSQLSRWLAKAGVKEDTIYAYIYAPGTCPRCESSLKLYRQKLGGDGKKLLLITVMKDKETAAFYNKKKGYAADYYIYDTENEYKNIFSFNNIALDGADMLKMTKAGRLITGYDGMNFSPELADELMARTEPMEYKNFGDNAEDDSAEWMYPISASGAKEMDTRHTDYKLNVTAEAPLCEMFRNPYFTGGMFFYPDELLGSVSVFRQKDTSREMAFAGSLAPTEQEKRMFVKVEPEMFWQMTQENSIHYIICNAWTLDGSHIGMSYSLPRIYYTSPDNIACFNQPCVLSRRLPGMEADTCTALDFDVFKEKFFYQHFQFSSTGSKIIVGCKKKTWPLEFEPEQYRDNVEMNPFDGRFYDTENPFMAVFDRRTGKLVERFGRIDALARKTFTGYYFVNPLSVVCGSELAYTDSYSGKVYVADTSDVAKETGCYTVFSIDESLLPAADTAKFYSYDCVKPYRKVYCRAITDMRITRDRLYCIVEYGDTSDPNDKRTGYTFAVTDRKTGKSEEYMFPQKHENQSVFGRGLRVLGDRAYPFEILKNGHEALLRVYGEQQE